MTLSDEDVGEPSLDPPDGTERDRVDVRNASFAVLWNHLSDPGVLGGDIDSDKRLAARSAVIWHLRTIFDICRVAEIQLDADEQMAYDAGSLSAIFERYA